MEHRGCKQLSSLQRDRHGKGKLPFIQYYDNVNSLHSFEKTVNAYHLAFAKTDFELSNVATINLEISQFGQFLKKAEKEL